MQTVSIKLNPSAWLKRNEGETLATFVLAGLAKRLTGKIVLVGGSTYDAATAKNWAFLFMSEDAI